MTSRARGGETLIHAGRNVNWYSHFENQIRFQKIKIELSYHSTIPMLDIYPRNTKSFPRSSSTSMFIAAIFTIAGKMNKSRYPYKRD